MPRTLSANQNNTSALTSAASRLMSCCRAGLNGGIDRRGRRSAQ